MKTPTTRKTFPSALPIFLVVALGLASGAVAQPAAIDLGTLGGTSSFPYAVNNHGQVVGTFRSPLPPGIGSTRVFHWTAADGMVDIGGFCCESSPTAINDVGQVVGWTEFGAVVRAFLWTSGGGMVDLGALPGAVNPSQRSSVATDVNNSGQVVGYGTILGRDLYFHQRHAFLWTASDGMVDLGTLGGTNSEAWAINERGQVVGSAETANGASHAFSWTRTGGMVDLGTGVAHDVNEDGWVVGSSGGHAFLWTVADGMVDLGTLGGAFSGALDINDHGQIVGSSGTTDPAVVRAFVWTKSQGMVELPPLPGYPVSEAGS